MLFDKNKKTEENGRHEAKESAAAEEVLHEHGETDLTKLSKKDLLEILLRQGEEIDKLRAEVDKLKEELTDKELKISRAGSIAEASLAVTGIFDEAQKAAMLYLQNVKRLVDERAKVEAGLVKKSSSEAGKDE